MLLEALDGQDVVLLWGWQGPRDQAEDFRVDYQMQLPMLFDEDRDLSNAYYVTETNGDAFALYPRHFVIDRSGDLAYAAAQYNPQDLRAALEGALAD